MKEIKLEDKDFVDAQDLCEILEEWVTCVQRGVRVEDGAGNVFTRAILIKKTLSDGSYVYDVRLA